MPESSPGSYRALMRRYGLIPNKRLGQHFLLQPQLVDKIADAAELDDSDLAVEIGPGLGILTEACARRAGRVIAVEKDGSLFPLLQEVLHDYRNVRLVPGDALEVDYNQLVAGEAPGWQGNYKVVGNLPYYLTSPLIVRLLSGGFQAELLVFMIQREVAARIVAPPGGKDYGSLSLLVRYYAEPEILFQVKPSSFYPPPEVFSTVIRLRRRANPAVEVSDRELLFRVIRTAFRYRRKTIQNALLQGGLADSQETAKKIFSVARLSPERRGETFDLKEFAQLTEAMLVAEERGQ